MNLKKAQFELDNIHITILPLIPEKIEQLKKSWLRLESIASPSFFLTWRWIGSWLEQIKNTSKLILVEATQNDRTVALGIFIEKDTTKYGLFKRKQWYLHRTGNDCKDQIWIENNTFLTTNENKDVIIQAIWQTLLSHYNHVDEFIIAINNDQPSKEQLSCTNKYSIIKNNTENGYFITLDKINTIDDYFSSLSKSTRKQLKRSHTLLTQQNEFKFSVTIAPEQQTQILSKCQQWHIDKWKDTETPSGFTNPQFTGFHKNLIHSDHTTSNTVVASLMINNELYGCLYCFLNHNCAYFYLSALKPIADNRIKLGLSLHALFIQWLIENKPNIKKYDFLAGEARYKQSLSNQKNEHCYLVIQKESIKFKLENLLINLKNKLQNGDDVKVNF
ncbi:GNAT family N-acetyltransferase [Colwellia sp. 1_MG-2023]|uniref:GNAT family N-acetyltransferase n=1 Tax=unclassified Colwellia TaxID=196834 RepID=UPI001C0A1FF5|nr:MULTISPECIES: GNAT family N-acetyltransferase [unclassified Colwellia]MBU2924927.1 GNAT family N-acetyltransferase [Colwellia sp. C2M11]MDO6652841.1 GNAT family N-acetyltransferase [Colwellia sp. 3_MG-2023]MDO6665843.1 GNAT family N-acetyltransferase [Colwellia sp. 2_MG-2023]MDO6690216.1 GNAT family N-acetyltransferase [Colwellia sp. 1_MG-2023]